MQINFNNHRDKLTDKDREEIFDILAKGLREKNRRRLRSMLFYGLGAIPHREILGRIQYSEEFGWSYCAGQSYPDEIRYVRSIILGG